MPCQKPPRGTWSGHWQVALLPSFEGAVTCLASTWTWLQPGGPHFVQAMLKHERAGVEAQTKMERGFFFLFLFSDGRGVEWFLVGVGGMKGWFC